MDEEREERNNQEYIKNEYDRDADRKAAAKTKLVNVGIDGEVSSD